MVHLMSDFHILKGHRVILHKVIWFAVPEFSSSIIGLYKWVHTVKINNQRLYGLMFYLGHA